MRRRHGGGEINLTPLLDVLFSILFIVLLAGAQSERVNADAAKEEADGLREEIAGLQEELDALKAQLESAETFRESARVVTVSNFAGDAEHRLRVAVAGDPGEPETVLLGTNRLENVSDRLKSLLEGVVRDGRGFPVYVLFHCDKGAIYRQEYEAVVRALEEVQREHREVFLQITEKSKEE